MSQERTAAAGPDQRDRAAGRDVEADPVQRPRAAPGVPEPHVPVLYPPRHLRRLPQQGARLCLLLLLLPPLLLAQQRGGQRGEAGGSPLWGGAPELKLGHGCTAGNRGVGDGEEAAKL